MGLDDWRRWLDVNAQDGRDGAVAMEVTTDGKLSLRTELDGQGIVLVLDYSDAGQLLDWLREGLGVLLARTGHPSAMAAVAGLQLARDTPDPS